MRLFRNLRVTMLMLIVGAIPGFAAFGFALITLYNEYTAREATATLASQVTLISELSFVAHELQRERGFSVGRLGATGDVFAEDLEIQREDTDVEVENFGTQRALIDRTAAAPAFLERLDSVGAALQDLGATRAAVDAGTADAAQVKRFYTGIVDDIIASVGVLSGISHQPELSRGLASYHYLLLSKESLGLQRAAGAAGFAAGQFDQESKAALRRTEAVERAMTALFRESAAPEHRDFLENVMSSGSAAEVDRMRSLALSQLPGEDMSAVDAAAWFEAASDLIDEMKNVEDTLVYDLIDRMEDSVAASDEALMLTVGVGAAGLLLSLLLSGAMILGVRQAFRGVIVPMAAMARGEIEVAVPPVSSNEFGEIAEALTVFQATAREKARLDAEAAERTAAALLRADAMEALRGSLGTAIGAAQEGDFTNRVSVETTEADLRDLAEAVNGLLSTTGNALEETVRVLTALADADLTARMDGAWSGDFARLRDGVEATASGLTKVVEGIRAAADAALARAGEIEQGAQELATRTESQAASLEQTAATMEQMSATVRSNAEALASAETLSEDARERTRQGRETVQSAVEAVRRIEAGAQRIAEIVSVIDGIAFQTNLLALNAGVEAARAGDAGRGFAVVAFEVRALAQRSAEAARDIAGLIRESAESVGEGVAMVDRTGEALGAIEATIEDLARTIANVATAGREQASGIGEINQAVASMDINTQKNASMADESMHSASALRAEIDRLDGLVAAFRTEGGGWSAHHAA